ncbi:MAG TPA: reverse transcriptase domain-containing protein, partial [Candidatus Hydrogenedentes bacterium]|nr:reverse transcriptase domain-containing protein [Candidatus Hydrogenedentota bacterium]
MFSPEELREAWDQVRTGGPAPGVDGVDQEAFRADVEGQLATLHGDLVSGQYRPQPCRTVDVPKPSGGVRRLVIPTLRDRVAQTAANQRLLPVIEPLLHPCCWSYRRGVGVQDALEAVARIRDDGWRWGIRADIARFFDTVPHAPLFSMLESLPVDPPLLDLLRAWLRAPQETPAGRVVPALGLPQGLPVSPLLSNFYLLPFDREMVRRQWRLVRYADDMALFFPAPEW